MRIKDPFVLRETEGRIVNKPVSVNVESTLLLPDCTVPGSLSPVHKVGKMEETRASQPLEKHLFTSDVKELP